MDQSRGVLVFVICLSSASAFRVPSHLGRSTQLLGKTNGRPTNLHSISRVLCGPSSALPCPSALPSGRDAAWIGSKSSLTVSARVLRSRNTVVRNSKAGGEGGERNEEEDDGKLPPSVLPICLGVFVQMLGEGIAISSIPLHLKGFGASAVQVGLATSAFSVAQMVCCPLIVKLSSRIGRTTVLRMCLAGATAASFVITLSPTINGVIFGRFLAGVFASAVPVAQAGVTDMVSGAKSALALSRVASANQMGIVVGPAVSALLASLFGLCGLAEHLQMRAVFFVSGLFALGVLAIDKMQAPGTPAALENEESKNGSPPPASTTLFRRPSADVVITPHPFAQVMLRSVALVIGWTLTLSVSTYCLFGSGVMGWGQGELSASFSVGAALTVFTQFFIFPKLVKKFGDHATCTAGLLGTATGLIGFSTCILQPFHSSFYLLNRVSSAVTDTATASLVSASSNGRDQRSQNLALIQSTRAGARIVTPVLSGTLFEYSNVAGWWPAVGALPYLTVATLALILTPLPFVLRRHDQRQLRELETSADIKSIRDPIKNV